MFVASITTLIILLNNENLNGEMQANVVHGEHNDAHQAHQEETLDYESLAPESAGPAVIVGLDGLVDFANEEFKKETRYIESEVKDQLFFSYIHPQDLAKILAAYGQVLSSQKPDLLVGPFRMKNAAGEYILHMAAMQPIFQDDRMVGVAIETVDISDKFNLDSSAGDYEIEELEDDIDVETYSDSTPLKEKDTQQDYEDEMEENTEDIQIESGKLDDESEFKYSNFESEYFPPAEQTAEHTENTSEDDSKEEGDTEEEIINNEDEVESTKEKEHEDQGNHYGEIKEEVEGAEDINKKPKDEKKIRDKTNEDKKLVVDNLARVVNKVYREPDVLALLF